MDLPRKGDVHVSGPRAPSLTKPGRDEGSRQSALSRCSHLPGWPVRRHCRGLCPAVLSSTEVDWGHPGHPAPTWSSSCHHSVAGCASVCSGCAFCDLQSCSTSHWENVKAGASSLVFVLFCHWLTFSKKEQFPFPPDYQACGPTVSDALPPHSRLRCPLSPVAKRLPLHASLASPPGDMGSSAVMCQNAMPSAPSNMTPHRCTTTVSHWCHSLGVWERGLHCQPVPLAHSGSLTRLRDSVDQATPQVQWYSRDFGGSPRCLCLARGDCCPIGEGCNQACPSSRDEAGVLQPKKGGGLRPILDLQVLKWALHKLVFKIQPQDWFAAIDLKDAYFHVLILPRHRPFLRFAFEGRALQYKVLLRIFLWTEQQHGYLRQRCTHLLVPAGTKVSEFVLGRWEGYNLCIAFVWHTAACQHLQCHRVVAVLRLWHFRWTPNVVTTRSDRQIGNILVTYVTLVPWWREWRRYVPMTQSWTNRDFPGHVLCSSV